MGGHGKDNDEPNHGRDGERMRDSKLIKAVQLLIIFLTATGPASNMTSGDSSGSK